MPIVRSRKTRLATAAFIAALATSVLLSTPASAAETTPGPVEVTGYDGKRAYDAAMSSDGKTLYVPNHGSDSISVIDVDSMRQTGTVSGFTGTRPYDMTISPDGSYAYVSADAIIVIDLATNSQVGIVPGVYGANVNIGFSADGTRAYVADGFNSSLYVIDTATHTRTATIPGFTGALLQGVTESPDGSVVLVANFGSNTVQVVDPRRNRVIGKIANFSGSAPVAITFSHDGTTAFVTNEESHSVSVIDVATLTETKSIPVDEGASRAVLSADGAYLFVATPRSSTVTIVDTAARTEVGPLPGYTGNYPRGLALAADGKSIFIAENVGNKVVRMPVPAMTATVSSMTPDRGVAAGGAKVTLTGTLLTGTTAVTFGGTPGTDLKVAQDGSSLTVTAPAHVRGDVDVIVEHPRGNALVPGSFAYFTVPGTPANVTAKPGHETVTLSWDAPRSDGGAAVSSYTVMHAPAGTDDWTVVTQTPDTSATAVGLENDADYMFRIAAENEAGMGAHHELGARPGAEVIDPNPEPTERPTAPPTGGANADGALAATGADSSAPILIGLATALAGTALLTVHLIRRRATSLVEEH